METNFPTQIVDLPSKGTKLYPEDSPLRKGQISMKYPTARDEDILTNQSYIEKGVVVDKLLQSLIVDKDLDYNELLIGDKNALLVAARILAYGKEYSFEYGGRTETIDLTQLPEKELDPLVKKATKNEFEFVCPVSGVVLTFKLLTQADENAIEQELKGLSKLHKDNVPELSTRLKYMILSVNGETDRKEVRQFVDNMFLAADARAFRKYLSKIQPDIEMKFYPEDGPEGGVMIPITAQFLYPDFAE